MATKDREQCTVFRASLAGIFVLLYAAISQLQAAEPSPDGAEFFEKKIRPIFVEKCQKCHGAARQKGGLRLDSRERALKGGDSGAAIVPGKPEKSDLIRAINYEADGFQMPPTGKLDADSIALLTEWVRLGAPWPENASTQNASGRKSGIDFAERATHWSFQPLRQSIPPKSTGPARSGNPVDCFIAARLAASGIAPAMPADRRTLLRRVTFDLIGLPPTIEELNVFLKDSSPTAYEKVVARLLASPHYGVRWGRHWLDLVRFAETCGHEFDFDIPGTWPYRDYVVRAFNDDVPYNDIVTEHVAGDLLTMPRRNLRDATNESIIGTAFWWFSQAKQSPVDLRAEECDTVDNQIDVLGKTFLGLTIACARCHDHKFDAIRTRDYYALAGFLRSSRQQFAYLCARGPIEKFAGRLPAQQADFVNSLAALLSEKTAAHWLPKPNPAEDRPDEIIAPWNALGSLAPGATFTNERVKLAAAFERADQQARNSRDDVVIYEDFLQSNYSGWRVSGTAFGPRPSRAGDFVPGTSAQHPIAEFAPHDAAHSGLISPRLRGAIRSRTFLVEKPFIHYHAYRRGPEADSKRVFKTGQLSLIVDNFQIIRDPLYGYLSLKVPADAPARWYSQNVSKLRGNKAYIEIADEDDGWIVVDSVVFSDDPVPPRDRPNRVIGALLVDTSVDTPKKLATHYANICAETLNLWKSGRLAADPFAADRVAILNWIGKQPLAMDHSPAAQELTALLSNWRRRQALLEPVRPVVAMVDGWAENEHVLIRGNPRKPGEEVPRRFLEVFGGRPIASTESGSGRLELAHEMTGAAAPLLARVLVNRLWQHHFGRGLVERPDEFGKRGQPPTHPELLDYLAGELIQSGWSIKHIQRLLVLSSTYQMSSRQTDPKAAVVDPDNRLLSRMPVKRLEAESIRDAILAVSGRLNEQLEGPSVPVHLDEFMTGRGRPARSGPLDGRGRRSIYLGVRRNFITPMFLAFDYPAPATTAGRRGTSNVPAQALALLNNPLVDQQARAWADRMLRNHGEVADAQIARLYETAFARLPTSEERIAARQFVEQQTQAVGNSAAWSDLCHVLFNVKEFIYIN